MHANKAKPLQLGLALFTSTSVAPIFFLNATNDRRNCNSLMQRKPTLALLLGQMYIHNFRAVTSSAAESEMKGWKSHDYFYITRTLGA